LGCQKACVLPENPASYRVVRTKSYLFNKAPHRVTYFTLLTTTLFFRVLKKLFSRKRSQVIHKQYRE
ncbi:hypothetical protein V9Z91_25605, partial [Klebsiella pneumoniae]